MSPQDPPVYWLSAGVIGTCYHTQITWVLGIQTQGPRVCTANTLPTESSPNLCFYISKSSITTVASKGLNKIIRAWYSTQASTASASHCISAQWALFNSSDPSVLSFSSMSPLKSKPVRHQSLEKWNLETKLRWQPGCAPISEDLGPPKHIHFKIPGRPGSESINGYCLPHWTNRSCPYDQCSAVWWGNWRGGGMKEVDIHVGEILLTVSWRTGRCFQALPAFVASHSLGTCMEILQSENHWGSRVLWARSHHQSLCYLQQSLLALDFPVTTSLILSKHYSSSTSVSDRQEHLWHCTSLQCFQEKGCSIMSADADRIHTLPLLGVK